MAARQASLRVETTDGQDVWLLPGDIIGRSPAASLRIDDPRISEAHALVSLREGALRLLALRGRFRVDGQLLEDWMVRVGSHVELSPDHGLRVLSVDVPMTLWMLREEGREPVSLMRTCSWHTGRGVVDGLSAEAQAQFWFSGGEWSWRRPGGLAQRCEPGRVMAEHGLTLEVVDPDAASMAKTHTSADSGPIHLIAEYDLVRFQRRGVDVGTVGGLGARLITELVQLRCASWSQLVGLLWAQGEADVAYRRRLDTLLWRTRRRLEALGLPPEMLAADGTGMVYLALRDEDVVSDRS